MKPSILFLATLLFSLNIALPASAQAGPQEMPISCGAPKPSGQHGLKRPRGDGNTWVFKINPAPEVHWVEGPNWSYPGKSGGDPSWGQWNVSVNKLSLDWISPNKLGTFNIKVTGKITCGGGGGGQPIDIEANWFGDVVSKNWEAKTDIEGGEMMLPQDQTVSPATPATVVVGAGAKVKCALLEATDRDTWTYGSQSGQEDDSVTYKWTASDGGFYPSGTATEANTQIAYWKAPTTTGTYTLQCVVDDGGDVQSPDTGTRDDDAITRTVQVEVADGHWEHSSWNTNDAKVQWSHTSNGDLDPVVNPKYATETLSWSPAAGGSSKPDKQVHVPYERTAFDRGFDESLCQYAATAKFVAHSVVSGGPDSAEIDGVAILTPSTNSAAANVQLSCPPASMDLSSFAMTHSINIAANITIVCVDPPSHFICTQAQARGMHTMGTGHAMDNPASTWSTGYDSYLTIDGNDVTLHHPDGTSQTYTWNGSSYDSPAGDYSVLTKTGTNTYVITAQDGSSQTFDIPSGSSYSNPMLVQMQDQFGNTTTLDRDNDGSLTKITDPTGQETTLSYDANGRLTGATDPYGETSSITYDSNGRIASVTGIDGRTISYGYDSNGIVTSVTTPEGTWTYDREIGDGSGDLGYDRRLTVTDPNGGKTEYYYDADNMRTYRVDPDDYTASNGDADVPKTYYNISRDPNDQAVINGNQDSNGNISHIERDPDTGLPISVTDALGNESTFTYNAQGQVTSTTDAAGKTTTYTYDSNGIDLLGITDADSNGVATFTYGSNHEVLTATDADNHTTTYTYTSWGDVATATNADGKVTTYNYNSTDHLLTSTSVDGSTVATYTYDTHQRVRTATGADGITQTYDYNDANQVTKITYPDNTTEQFSYDCSCGSPSEHITKYTDRAGNESTFAYDANGNRTAATDANGTTVNFAYNGNDQLEAVTDGNGNSTAWLYDALGRATQKIFADGSYEKYFYDSIGQISQQRMANGVLVNFTYDNRGNVTKIDYPNMADVSYTYTNLNQVATMTDGIGTSTYGYDTMGRLTSVDGPWSGDTITYSYDALGRRSEVNLNGNVTYYDYDSLSRLSSVTHGGDTFGYAYNGASGQLNHVTLPNGTKSTFSYDSLGRLSSVQDKVTSSSANISQFTYGYDNRDVQTSVQRALGTGSAQTVNYTYDNIGQLTGETSTETTPLVDNSYSYDDAGNRLTSSTDGTSSSFTLDAMNQISGYTLGGNAVTVDYDANGNTTQLGFQSMTYDDADRLTSVIQKNPLTGDNVKKMEYEYDGLSRRRVSTTYTWNAGTSSWTQQDERHFIYDGMDLIQERDGSNTVIASYVRDGNIGGVLSRTTSSGTFYYHYDGNGNVVAMTNTSGAIVAQYTYDAYGNLTAMSGTEAAANPIRFSTKYFDSNTGYYDFGFRSYDPTTGRWLNRDPIGESGGLNLYGFVGNSPGNAVDAYGLWDFPPTHIRGIAHIFIGEMDPNETNNQIMAWNATHIEIPNFQRMFGAYDKMVIHRNATPLDFLSVIADDRTTAIGYYGHGNYAQGGMYFFNGGNVNLNDIVAAMRRRKDHSKLTSAQIHSCGTGTDKMKSALVGKNGSFWGTTDFYMRLGPLYTSWPWKHRDGYGEYKKYQWRK